MNSKADPIGTTIILAFLCWVAFDLPTTAIVFGIGIAAFSLFFSGIYVIGTIRNRTTSPERGFVPALDPNRERGASPPT